MKIIEKLSTYAALIGVIGAIGGGFYTWGQFNSRLDAIEKKPRVNLKPLHEKDKALTEQFDEVLLYANEYKVDLIDRINKVEEKIKPTDLSGVKKEIAEIREDVAGKKVNLTPVYQEISKLREEVAALDIPEDLDLGPLLDAVTKLETDVAIALKENELQDIQISEIKKKANNPLAN